MGKNRVTSALVHVKNKKVYPISKEKATGKFFIRGTNTEVPENRLCRKGQNPEKMQNNYNFAKPSQAQGLGDEWEHYAWGADDY